MKGTKFITCLIMLFACAAGLLEAMQGRRVAPSPINRRGPSLLPSLPPRLPVVASTRVRSSSASVGVQPNFTSVVPVLKPVVGMNAGLQPVGGRTSAQDVANVQRNKEEGMLGGALGALGGGAGPAGASGHEKPEGEGAEKEHGEEHEKEAEKPEGGEHGEGGGEGGEGGEKPESGEVVGEGKKTAQLSQPEADVLVVAARKKGKTAPGNTIQRLQAWFGQFFDNVLARLAQTSFDDQIIDLTFPLDPADPGSEKIGINIDCGFKGWGDDPTQPIAAVDSTDTVVLPTGVDAETFSSLEGSNALLQLVVLKPQHVWLLKAIILALAWQADTDANQAQLAAALDAKNDAARDAAVTALGRTDAIFVGNLSMFLSRFSCTLDVPDSDATDANVGGLKGPDEIFVDAPDVLKPSINRLKMQLAPDKAQWEDLYGDALRPLAAQVSAMRSMQGYNERTAYCTKNILPLISKDLSPGGRALILTALRFQAADINKGFTQDDIDAGTAAKTYDDQLKQFIALLKAALTAMPAAGFKQDDYKDLTDFVAATHTIDDPMQPAPALAIVGDGEQPVVASMQDFLSAWFRHLMATVVLAKFDGSTGPAAGEDGFFAQDEGYLFLDYAVPDSLPLLLGVALRGAHERLVKVDGKVVPVKETQALIAGTLPIIALRSSLDSVIAQSALLATLAPLAAGKKRGEQLTSFADVVASIKSWADSNKAGDAVAAAEDNQQDGVLSDDQSQGAASDLSTDTPAPTTDASVTSGDVSGATDSLGDGKTTSTAGLQGQPATDSLVGGDGSAAVEPEVAA